jgi:methylated-DNA-protein-cysteine methyltransferase-like protein
MDQEPAPNNSPSYQQRIYTIVRQVPYGKVATYGQVAKLAGRCTARMVGYALSSLPQGSDVPWQRVINSQGKISPHGHGLGSLMQQQLLQAEGVIFDLQDRIDLFVYGWLAIDKL